jgi:subtilisin-like proprotein convertase family protein
MKKIVFILLMFLLPALTISQIIYSPSIDSVITLVSPQHLTKYIRDLSGDTITTVGGLPCLIYSRHHSSPSNQKAAEYIYEKFISFGLQARYQYNNSHIVNVIARKTGSVYPYRKFVISAHYDNTLSSSPSPFDTVHGADDNASGVAAVLEAARLLANYNLAYSVEFVAFDEEEIGLLGSTGYADTCLISGDTFMAVLNLDMVSWDGNNDGFVRIKTADFTEIIADMLIRTYQVYNIALTGVKEFNQGGSDHLPFWYRGMMAITSIEPGNDFHPFYHTIGDNFSTVNMNYLVKNVKANIGTLLSLSNDYIYYMIPYTIPSGIDTLPRNGGAFVYYPIPIGSGTNAPRLYYKVGNGQYQYVNADTVNGNYYSFTLPGQPPGTNVSYYYAAQDSAGNYLITYPAGGSGVNPPGTTPPPNVLAYYVWEGYSQTSNNQKTIIDVGFTYDTIYIAQDGIIEDINLTLNINHTNDGDILVSLMKQGSTSSTLSQFNGENGQNYTNTNFCDSASVSITQGVPPFTGYFRPENLFGSVFRGRSMQGNWILRIYDRRAGDTGSLLNWTLNIKYSTPIAVKNENNQLPDKFVLYQNYPNPFNPVTVIKYSIPKANYVSLAIYDILGREIKTLVNEYRQAGTYTINWDASNYPSGIYFYRLNTKNFTDTKKMVLIK